ncbi:plasmid recombination protein, partial [mine drainage metagenome]
MSQVVFRFKKIKSSQGVVNAVTHDERLRLPDRPENADPNKHIEIVVSAGADPESSLKKKLSGVWKKRDSVLAVEAIMSASPEFFASEKIEYGKWDKSKVDAFRDAGEKFLREEFGDNILSLSFHLDEATPHFQCLFVPIVDGKLNAKAVLGDITKMRLWQDKAHRAVEHLGIERG